MQPSQVWQLGDYATAGDRFAAAGAGLAAELVRPGDRVLDVACGPGVVAIAAARAGVEVTGLDVAPNLLAQARARAESAGVSVRWVEADMTAMPEPDAHYHRVLSAFGVIFAGDPAAMAAELVRVCRPGGLVGLLAWTPDSPFGQLGPVLARFLPAGTPMTAVEAWGDPARVRGFFAGQPVTVETRQSTVEVRWPTRQAAVDELASRVPGGILARSAIEPTGRWPEALAAVDTMYAAAGRTDPDGFVLPVPYLTTLARRDQPAG